MKPCKDNRYATNKGGIIKAPKPVTDSPKSNVVKGSDLRNGKQPTINQKLGGANDYGQRQRL